MNFDLQKILQSKAAHRRKLAQLPIGEKLRLLDAMREQAIAIRNAVPGSAAPPTRVAEEQENYRGKSRPGKS